MKKIILYLLSIYCILSPFYLINSGYPQIADIFLVFAFILFVLNYRIKTDRILITIVAITFLIVIINTVWGLIYEDVSFNLKSLYYVFNFLPVIIILNLYNYFGKDILRTIYKAIFTSLLIQVLISPILINPNVTRQFLMFNNPNQLGYYSLLSLSILTLLFYLLRFGLLQYLIIILSTTYLVLLSNSSSAIIAVTIILLTQSLLIIKYRLNSNHKIILMIAVLFLSLAGVMLKEQIVNVKLIDNAVTRIQGKEATASNTLAERHYDRMFNNFELVLIGAGEGLYDQRFGGTEMHSTVMSFLFNYGITTMLLLLLLFLLLIKKPTLIPLIILFSIHFYGLTHNGIRQPYFWLMNAIIFIGNSEGDYDFTFVKNLMKRKKKRINSYRDFRPMVLPINKKT